VFGTTQIKPAAPGELVKSAEREAADVAIARVIKAADAKRDEIRQREGGEERRTVLIRVHTTGRTGDETRLDHVIRLRAEGKEAAPQGNAGLAAVLDRIS
jgi:hypothetical protein